jgi:putative hemolysin
MTSVAPHQPVCDPFRLDDVPMAIRWALDRALALPQFRAMYGRMCARAGDGDRAMAFEERVLRELDVRVDVSPGDVPRIPAVGAVVVAANHPHGILDGLVAASLVRRIRPDVRVLANHLLARIPELHDLCFFVDPFEGDRAAARSLAGLRAAHLWLRQGGALVMFPAGDVAHGPLIDGARSDSPWRPTMMRLARATQARVVRLQISGCNSRLFYAAGGVHRSLRSALLPRELLKKRGTSVRVAVRPAAADIDAEIERLRPSGRLVESGAFEVFCAAADRIPATLAEIGRLREIAYRGVGEGTGNVVDIDRFDAHYEHLFLWDRSRRLVAGAYRLGRSDAITQTHGLDGLYTRTLFRYDERLLAGLGGPALELGRSFVRQEYQKQYLALLMLWKGIGAFVVRHPQYRRLFGPVSISARYSDVSQRLLIAFLEQNHLAHDLATLVSAVHGVPAHHACPPPLAAPPATIDDVSRFVAAAERDGKGIPVLLRQYLKLNARVVGFNVDPAFGDALDALMVVDLADVEPSILSRYLGKQAARQLGLRRECRATRDSRLETTGCRSTDRRPRVRSLSRRVREQDRGAGAHRGGPRDAATN